MAENFVPVGDTQGLEALFARSKEGPVLIFKHSLTCPISAAAYTQVRQLEREVALVVVQQAREVSREVESRTGVRHESPQALVLLDQKVVWADSHWGVTADRVERAMRDAEKSLESGVESPESEGGRRKAEGGGQ